MDWTGHKKPVYILCMSDHLTPLEVCLAMFGSRSAVEEIAGCRPKSSYAWARQSTLRRAGDLPPRVQRAMLAGARRRHVALPARWLIEGASRAAIEAALARPDGMAAE